MILREYCYSEGNQGWDFQCVNLNKISLLIGATGSGKSRFLNTIFNFSAFVNVEKTNFRIGSAGRWEIQFGAKNKLYNYALEITKDSAKERTSITHELLEKIGSYEEIGNPEMLNKPEKIIERTASETRILGEKVPKITHSESAISIFKEEDEIQPIFESIIKVSRRDFSSLKQNDDTEFVMFNNVETSALNKGKMPASITTEILSQYHSSPALFILKKVHPDKYEAVINQYKSIFPFIESIRISNLRDELPGFTPVVEIKEKKLNTWIPAHQLSSGMKKVLLLLTDIQILPNESLYLIDEYENSLGANAIDFFPPYLATYSGASQFLITTHHPFLINNINIKDWFLFNRDGQNVRIIEGEELAKKYGKSRLHNYSLLQQDPLFTKDEA